jgi:hypothetical protein
MSIFRLLLLYGILDPRLCLITPIHLELQPHSCQSGLRSQQIKSHSKLTESTGRRT